VAEKPHDVVVKFDVEIYSGIARFSLRLHGFLVCRINSVRLHLDGVRSHGHSGTVGLFLVHSVHLPESRWNAVYRKPTMGNDLRAEITPNTCRRASIVLAYC